MKKEAINEIRESYYGFLELTKQIALYMPCRSAKKTKTHEEIRKKVLQGMEIIAENVNISKSPSDSALQPPLHDPNILRNLALELYPSKFPTEQQSNHEHRHDDWNCHDNRHNEKRKTASSPLCPHS